MVKQTVCRAIAPRLHLQLLLPSQPMLLLASPERC